MLMVNFGLWFICRFPLRNLPVEIVHYVRNMIVALIRSRTWYRRELLSDRKNPYAHLTARKLCWTAVCSTTVAAVPILNDVVLDAAKEVIIDICLFS